MGLHQALSCMTFSTCLLCSVHSQGEAHLTIDRERVYDKENFMLKCSFPPNLALTSVKLDAFNGTHREGSMFCDVASGTSTQAGVFTGSTFNGCPTFHGGSRYVSVTMQASPKLELNYNCTLKVNDGLQFYTLRSSTIHFEMSGQAHLTIDSERVYEKENFILTCSFPSYLSLTSVTLDAFNDTSREGSMFCDVVSGTSTQAGVFAGSTFNGCPTYPGGSGYVSVTMQASPMLEFNYICTLKVNDLSSQFYTLLSNTIHFEMSVMPEVVFPTHDVLYFNESDNVTLACHSRFGKPPAIIILTVTQQEQSPLQHIENSSVSLQLPQPLRNWNNSSVTCKVENHRLLKNMTYRGVLQLNYLFLPGPTYYKVCTTLKSATLNCSALSNPPPVYSWDIPPGIQGSILSPQNEAIVVPQFSSGRVICTIFNPVTGKQADITFYVNSAVVEIVVGVTISAIVIIGAIVVLVLYKQRRIFNEEQRTIVVSTADISEMTAATNRSFT